MDAHLDEVRCLKGRYRFIVVAGDGDTAADMIDLYGRLEERLGRHGFELRYWSSRHYPDFYASLPAEPVAVAALLRFFPTARQHFAEADYDVEIAADVEPTGTQLPLL